jgi:hydrogenase maturation factor HypF (carbamoyltransferase family)
MAFSDMNDVEQELGEEKPPASNGNRTFLIIAGVLGGIMVVALLSILGVALIRNISNQRAAQSLNATKAAQNTAIAVSAKQTATIPTVTATRVPTFTPTNTLAPTHTPVIVLAPSKSPTVDLAIATRNALLTQAAVQTLVTKPSVTPPKSTSVMNASATPPKPTSTALPRTGIADELGTPGYIVAAFVLVAIIFIMRRLRTAS